MGQFRSAVAVAFLRAHQAVPEFRGKVRLSRIVGETLGSTVVLAPGGVRIDAMLSSPMDLAILDGSAFVPEVLQRAIDEIQHGDTVVDVGANVGYVTFLAARRVGPAGRVFAIEPSPREYLRLIRGIDANAAANVIPMNVALSDSAGEASLGVAAFHTGVNRLVPGSGGALPGGQTALPQVRVALLPGDALFGNCSQPIGLVKIDVEGAEMRVLRGLSHTIRERRPRAFLVEITDKYLRDFGSSATELYDYMKSLGYRPLIRSTAWQHDEIFLPSDE